MDETDRRRELQIEYNKAHNITPKGVVKPIKDIIEGIAKSDSRGDKKLKKAAESYAPYEVKAGKTWAHQIVTLEKQMYAHAKNLEFEQAAAVRDQIKTIRDQNLIKAIM